MVSLWISLTEQNTIKLDELGQSLFHICTKWTSKNMLDNIYTASKL